MSEIPHRLNILSLLKVEIRVLDVGRLTHYFPTQTDLEADRRKLNIAFPAK